MALTQRLELRQGQSLVMTPQLQQAIKLLQLSNLELAEYVEAELERNPLLEHEEGAEGTAAEQENVKEQETQSDTPLDQTIAREDFVGDDQPNGTSDDGDEATEKPAPSELEPAAPLVDWSRTGSGARMRDGEDGIEGSLAAQPTLRDHLTEQLGVAAFAPAQRLIAAVLIESVDEAGYLRADLGEVAERLGATADDIHATLAELQGFDPPGVFARDIAECLALQLKDRDRLDPAMQVMLTRLDLVAKRDLNALSALCGLSTDDIAEMMAEIRALKPKPGLAFDFTPVQAVVPDVYVREGADGWNVELNSDTLPKVLINSRYYAKVNATARSSEERAYIAECFNNANWLVKSLDQRARTILKVASEIVRQQDAFLAYGVRHLRPLNLRTIADAIGMHESTVSRVTSNKYMATPRGLFELKYFFTAAIAAVDGGEAHSAEAVRDRIREFIDKEDVNEILSDDRIVALLGADGVNIARRTVAKYREAMRIPSSVERRRLRLLNEEQSGR